MDRLAVVILNFNGKDFLEKFLPVVLKCTEGFPVYVADNGSTDQSCELLKYNFPGVRLIAFPDNQGFAGGYNAALRQVEASYYLLLNSDVEVTPGWLAPLVSFMDAHPDCAACQPKIRSFSQKENFEYAGAAGGFIDQYGFPFCRGRVFNTLEADGGQYNEPREIFWASGACMMVRAESFHQAGGFDADFFAHMEEIDLCWRMKKAGWKIFYTGESLVYHVGGGTLPKSNPRKTYLNFKNNHAMLIKNYNSGELLKILPVRLLMDLAASVKFFIFDSVADGWAVLKALGRVYWNFPRYRIKKNVKDSVKRNEKISGVYRGSIVLDYFLKRKRIFAQLDFQ